MIAGASIFVVGLLLTFSGRIPWLGNLPGDLRVEREGFSIFVPLTTMILLSLLLTLVLNLVARLFR